METEQFESLTRVLSDGRSRRGLLGLIAGSSLVWFGRDDADARKRKKRKKKKKACTTCDAGQACQGGKCVALPCGQGGPCLVFVTSTTHDGNLNGLTGADGICQTRANSATPAPLPGSYKAWLADTSSSLSTRFVASSGPYRLVDGTIIAANWTDLTDGSLAAPIDVTENGMAAADLVETWTNVQPNGTSAGDLHCMGWGSVLFTDSGGNGLATSSSATWTQEGAEPCAVGRRLYCFQQS